MQDLPHQPLQWEECSSEPAEQTWIWAAWEGVPGTCSGQHRNLQLKLPSEAGRVGSSDPAHTGWENMT